MASVRRYNEATMRDAKKGGYKRKKPKKPRASASVPTLLAYIQRYNDWIKGAETKAKEYRAKQKLLTQIRSI